MKCCEKGSRGKTRIRRESVARRGQCCEKGDLQCILIFICLTFPYPAAVETKQQETSGKTRCYHRKYTHCTNLKTKSGQ